MAKRKIYVLSKIGLEYNDEFYYLSESKYSEPVKAFSTRQAAEKAIPKYANQIRSIMLEGSTEKDWEEYVGDDFPDNSEFVKITELLVEENQIVKKKKGKK